MSSLIDLDILQAKCQKSGLPYMAFPTYQNPYDRDFGTANDPGVRPCRVSFDV